MSQVMFRLKSWLLSAVFRRAPRWLGFWLARGMLRETHPFDLRHGTDTGGLLYASDLVSGHAHDEFNEGYYATTPSLFRGLVARWVDLLASTSQGDERRALRLEDYAFVDLGCGKGRALLLASEYRFRTVTGLELHPGLCAVAEKNARRWLRRKRACGRISVLCADVLAAPIPDGPVVLFLFNSFSAEVVRGLMEQLTERSRGRSAPIDLLYVHPDQAAIVERAPGVEVLFNGDIFFSREDRLADVFGVGVDRCGVYRITMPASVSSA